MGNLNWAGSRKALFRGQSPLGKQDLAVRVILMKLRVMMSYVKDENLVAAYVRLVEFKCSGFRTRIALSSLTAILISPQNTQKI